jgi:hypothetical protein
LDEGKVMENEQQAAGTSGSTDPVAGPPTPHPSAGQSEEQAIEELRDAFKQKRLTLYLGAGVSVASELPTWDRLVLSMYFKAIAEQQMQGWRPFANYLYAIAEWHLKRSPVPLEITARKIRKYYPDQDKFLLKLREALYELFVKPLSGEINNPYAGLIRQKNSTLNAVVELIQAGGTRPGEGVKSVITYNYDNLLEIALNDFPHQAVFDRNRFDPDKLPVYHVHGYVPFSPAEEGSAGDEIVFTEDQYHLVAQDSYGWSNVVQIQALSGSVGLMIGLSLGDRNMRRLLDAISKAPVGARNYALIAQPTWKAATDGELDAIHETAKGYIDRFRNSGIKEEFSLGEREVFYQDPKVKASISRPGLDASGVALGREPARPMRVGVKPGGSEPTHPGREGQTEPIYRSEIRAILGEVERFDVDQQKYVLDQLGIQPIFLKNGYGDIGRILSLIAQ